MTKQSDAFMYPIDGKLTGDLGVIQTLLYADALVELASGIPHHQKKCIFIFSEIVRA